MPSLLKKTLLHEAKFSSFAPTSRFTKRFREYSYEPVFLLAILREMEFFSLLHSHSLYDRYMAYIERYLNVANRYMPLVPITLKRTVVKIGGSLRLTLPTEVAELMRVKEGDIVEFLTTNGDVVIRKSKS